MSELRLTFEVDSRELAAALSLGDRVVKQAEDTFNKFIFEVHKYLIRITPIDTGELRGGWTSWLDRNQIDYSRQIVDTSIAEKAPGRDYHFDPGAIEQGRTQSQFESPSPFENTITNNVAHGFYLDQGTSRIPARNFVEQARYKAEFIFEQTFDAWFKKLEAQPDGEVVESDPAEEPAA